MQKLTDLMRWPGLRSPDHRMIDAALVIGIIGACLFIDTELVALVAGLLWSLAGYLHLPGPATAVLAVALGLPTLWLCGLVCVLVFNAETDPENN